MDKKILKAEIRKISGRKVKTLRAKGILPANIYGKKIKSESIQVILKEFQSLYKEVGETGLFNVELEKDSKPVLIHQVQFNSKTGDMIHVDLLQVDLKEKVTAEVPAELIGESPATKQGLGTVVQQLNNIEVEALPADLPEKFEIDITGLAEVDQAIYVKDIKVDYSKVKILTDMESIVAKVEPPQKEEVVETPIVAVGADGAVPAEGEVPDKGQSTSEGKSEESSKE